MNSAVIYLYKPFFGFALVGCAVFASFLIARGNASKARLAAGQRAAIVTGVSRGLGEALANTLLLRGYAVLGIGRTSGARLAGSNYRFVELDLAKSAQVDSTLTASFAQMAATRPDFVCLINNAPSARRSACSESQTCMRDRPLAVGEPGRTHRARKSLLPGLR